MAGLLKPSVAVLCASERGHYPGFYGVDVYDRTRDARTFAGGVPVVAHPPCGPWGKLRGLCRNQDPTLGPWCVEQVRRWGGVLEHPAHSLLWDVCNLPAPGYFPDEFGGFTVETTLSAFGAPVRKPTWVYICGREPWPMLPPIRRPSRRVDGLHSADRQLTPLPMCLWLLDLAVGCSPCRRVVSEVA